MFFSLQLPEIIALLIGENMPYFAKMFFLLHLPRIIEI